MTTLAPTEGNFPISVSNRSYCKKLSESQYRLLTDREIGIWIAPLEKMTAFALIQTIC
jgi:hypothetical protein